MRNPTVTARRVDRAGHVISDNESGVPKRLRRVAVQAIPHIVLAVDLRLPSTNHHRAEGLVDPLPPSALTDLRARVREDELVYQSRAYRWAGQEVRWEHTCEQTRELREGASGPGVDLNALLANGGREQ